MGGDPLDRMEEGILAGVGCGKFGLKKASGVSEFG
jgi:hypothetical protein